jgi:hypothetical protein
MAKTKCARRKGIFGSKTCVGFSRQGSAGPRLLTYGNYSAKAHFHEGLHPSTAINYRFIAIFAFLLVCETWMMDECDCYVLYSRAGE